MKDSQLKSKKTVNVLWTGGYDSTYRILQLSKYAVTIQSYYLSDNRASEEKELASIIRNMSSIMNRSETKCTFSPLIIIDKKNRKNYPNIEQAYTRLREKYFLSSQYEWLACFSHDHKGIELSVHEGGPIPLILNQREGGFIKCSDEIIGDYYIVDEKTTEKDIYTVFKDFHFPIVGVSKLEMKKYYLENQSEHIMNHTWFCHTPINSKPCGICNPCHYSIKEGMANRFSKMALFRHRFRKLFLFKQKAKAYLNRRIRKIFS